LLGVTASFAPDRKDQLEGESLPVKKAPANFLVVKRFESLRLKHDKVRNEFDACLTAGLANERIRPQLRQEA
jgi:hypothetical protein